MSTRFKVTFLWLQISFYFAIFTSPRGNVVFPKSPMTWSDMLHVGGGRGFEFHSAYYNLSSDSDYFFKLPLAACVFFFSLLVATLKR